MGEIVVQRPHGMRLASAKRRADDMARRLQRRFGGSYAWQQNELHFRRTGASGMVAVTPHDVEIRLTLSILLAPLRARIEREIHKFLDEQLAKDGNAPTRSRTTRRPRPA